MPYSKRPCFEHATTSLSTYTFTDSRFIQLLADHPYFVIHALGASSRSAGQEYAKVTKWKLATQIPAKVKTMVVNECKPDVGGFSECGVVFSGLDHDVAGDIGESSLGLHIDCCLHACSTSWLDSFAWGLCPVCRAAHRAAFSRLL
jgi:hypothetical protein